MRVVARIAVLVLVALLALVASACNPGVKTDNGGNETANPPDGAATTPSLVKEINPDGLFIIYSYETNGKMETCGCSARQLGGLARRGTLISDYVENFGRNVLVLDGGKLLPDNSEFARFKAAVVLKMMSKMGYEALHLGFYEFNFEPVELATWADNAGFPLVSSNVLFSDNSPTLVRPEVLKRIGSQDVSSDLSPNGILKTAGRKEAGEKVHWAATPVLFIKKGNIRIGIVSATQPEWLEGLEWKNLVAMPIKETFQTIVAKYKDRVDLWVAMVECSNVTTQKLMDDVPEIKIWLSGNPRKGESEVKNTVSSGGQHWQNIFQDGKYIGVTSVDKQEQGFFVSQEEVPVEDKIKQRDDLQAIMINEFRPKLESIYKLQTQPMGKPFVPALSCKKCHLDQYNAWQGSAHGHAYDTLKEKGQNFNLDCVKCHIDYDSLNDAQLTLQCTACHYKAWEKHVEEAEAGQAVTPLAEKIDKAYCIKCHSPENSTNFEKDYAKYFEKLKHWKGATVPGEDAAPVAGAKES